MFQSATPPLTKQKKRSNRHCTLKQDEENNKKLYGEMLFSTTTYKDARFSDDEKRKKMVESTDDDDSSPQQQYTWRGFRVEEKKERTLSGVRIPFLKQPWFFFGHHHHTGTRGERFEFPFFFQSLLSRFLSVLYRQRWHRHAKWAHGTYTNVSPFVVVGRNCRITKNISTTGIMSCLFWPFSHF